MNDDHALISNFMNPINKIVNIIDTKETNPQTLEKIVHEQAMEGVRTQNRD